MTLAVADAKVHRSWPGSSLRAHGGDAVEFRGCYKEWHGQQHRANPIPQVKEKI